MQLKIRIRASFDAWQDFVYNWTLDSDSYVYLI